MEKTDISYKNENLNIKFNFRVALLFINDNKILLQKSTNDSYWSLIGGRVKLNEDTKSSIIREVKEETGIVLKKEALNLVNTIENFFVYNDTKFHEILYIYRIDDNEQLKNMDNFKTLDKDNVINKWIDVKDIKKMDIRPEIIKNNYDNKKLISFIIGK